MALLRDDPATEYAKAALPWILAQSSSTFRASDLYQHKRRQFDDSTENRDAGLRVLEERQFIRRRDCKAPGPGRPPVEYEVNPKARTGNTRNPTVEGNSVDSVYARNKVPGAAGDNRDGP